MSNYYNDLQYVEKVQVHPVFSIIILLFIGFLAHLKINFQGDVPDILLLFLILFLSLVYANFMKLDIIITSEKLIVGFGVIKHKIRLDNIDHVKIRKPPWYYYGGLGIRFGWDWSIGFLQNYKRGILITPIKGRKIFFSTNNPEKIINILEEQKNIF